MIQLVLDFVKSHQNELLLGGLFLWSEVLGKFEKFKNSSVYDLVLDLLKKAAGK